MKQIHINLSEKLIEQLKKEAEARGITVTGYIRMILIERRK